MALLRKFFYKKPPDGLLEITERVYVFDYCFTTDVMDEDEYKMYIRGIIRQLHDHFPDASYMVFNMREGENHSQISKILGVYDMTVMDYPRQYEGCPLLPMEMIHHFLRSGENWLQLGLQNIVLMHCERGGWPVLAFMLAALLVYRKQFTGEQKTLDMIYKQAPRELLQLMSPLNPIPSQLRYLQYISRRNVGTEWPPLDRALTLDCIIIRLIPNMDGAGGCRPIFRIYGQDPFMAADRTPKVLFATPKSSKLVRHYKQADCELVKIDIHCHVQGDVVLECISLDSDLEREKMMFRVMFNTAFIRSNILMLNRNEIDILWNAKDQFPKNFRVEVLFSDMDSSSSVISIDLPHIEEKDGLPVEAFAKVKEIFSNVDWLDSRTEVVNVLQQITASNILLEKLDSGVSAATSSLLKESLSGRLKFDSKTQNDMQGLGQGELSMSPFESTGDIPTEKKIEPLESMALPENDIKAPVHMGQENQPVPSSGLSTDFDSPKKQPESLESKESLENDAEFPTSMAQGKQFTPLIEPSIDANSMKKKIGSLESKENDIESLESKSLLPNDTMCPSPASMAEEKQIPLESNEKENESLDSKASLENDRRFNFEPQTLPEIDIKSPPSAVQGKFSTPSFESSGDASVEKKIESLESKNNIKTLAPMNSAATQIESSESHESLENDTEFPTSMAQGKQSLPIIEPSMDANSMKKKIGPFESKEKNIESLESKVSLEIDTMCPPSKSIPSIEPSMDANSMTKKTGESEPVLSENDIKSLTSTVHLKQCSPLLEPPIDADSIKKKIKPQELQVALQLPTQTKIISPRLHQAIHTAPVSYSNSLLGSPISRFKSSPSALGITSVLQDNLPVDIKEEVTHAVTVSPPSTLSPSASKVPKSVEPSSASALPASPPTLHPSSPLKHSVDALATIEKTCGLLAPAVAPPPPPPPPGCEATSKMMQSIVTQHPENTMHDKSQKSLVTPPLPPPPPHEPPSKLMQSIVTQHPENTIHDKGHKSLVTQPPPPPPPPHEAPSRLMQSIVVQHPENTTHDKCKKSLVIPSPPPLPSEAINSSLSMLAPQTRAHSSPSSSTKNSSLSHPPAPSIPGKSLSTVKDSFKGPPPPPPPPPPPSSTGQTSSSSVPPPPPLPGFPSSAVHPLSSPLSMNTSAAMSGPPPPPPPPRHSGTTPGPTPRSPVPPPPPPPASASKNSEAKNSANVPPVPPPPLPSSANGLSKSGTASLQSHVGAGNANVPPVPGPPSGAPFGAKGRGLMRPNSKSVSQIKRSNLKPYHWLKLTRAVQGSLWAETQKLDDASRAPEFDMSELESLFSAAAPNSDHGKGGKLSRSVSGQKADKVQLIELRRAYNCEIMLSKVKIPLPDLVSSVLALDDSVLYVDQVENLIKFCPTKEEMELLKGYNGDKENLGKCEQFFLELMKVPRVENKLRVFSFKMQFFSQVSELRRDLNIVNSASEEIRNSMKLKRIMQTILSLGNALNHGTARGSAIGFRLDSLLKLTDTRARNNKMTLMHYLCKVLAEKLPELLDFHKDLVNLEASTKIQLKYLAEEMQAISKGLEKVVQELTASENDGPVSENFCQILKEFLSHAEAEVRSLAQLYANVGRNADALALYFGEDPARCPFEQVVSTLLNFVRMFIRAHEENCKKLEFEKRKAEKEAKNEKLKLAAKECEPMMQRTIKSENIK